MSQSQESASVCRQCRGENDGRAIECGYCGGSLRTPYRGDPLGTWLRELNRDFTSNHLNHWFETLIFVIVCLAPLVAGAGSFWLYDWTPAWSVALAVGLFLLLGGLTTPLENHLATRRRRAAFESIYLPKIEAFRDEHDIEAWRLLVVCGESFDDIGLIRGYLLSGRALAGRGK